MEIFIKAVAGVLISAVVTLILSKQGKDFSVLLVICVCCMIGAVALDFFQKILDFIRLLEKKGNLNYDLISILLKGVGIGILSEITMTICTDSGNAALGKMIQFLSSAVILWLCIPLFTQLLDLIESVLSAV